MSREQQKEELRIAEPVCTEDVTGNSSVPSPDIFDVEGQLESYRKEMREKNQKSGQVQEGTVVQ